MAVIFQNLRGVQYDNGEIFQGAVCAASPSVTYATGGVSASTDPFSGKSNKYAESKLVRIYAGAAAHVEWSSAGTTATTSSYAIPAGESFHVIANGGEYLRIIPNSGTVSFWVTEIY